MTQLQSTQFGSTRTLLQGLALASTMLSPAAFAQSEPETVRMEAAPAAAAETDGSFADGEILVTGTRKSRAEALKDVAVAISAFSGEQLETMHATNLTDIGRMTPGARLEANGTFPASANFFIRGIGVNTTNPSDDPTVGIFADGMYLGVNIGALTDMFDIESVEVLRGPQGTLFGRNVTGGAVVVRSRRPSGEFGVRGEATIGRFDRRDLSVAVEGPLVQDRLNAKLAVIYKDRDGLFSNAFSPKDRIARSDSLIFRPMLEWKPSDRLTLTVIGEIGEQNDDGTPAKNLAVKGAAIPTTPPVPTGKFDLTNNLYAHTDTNWKQVVGEGVLEVGDGKITATVGYRKLDVDNEVDIDGTEASLFHFLLPTGLRQHQTTAEIVYATTLWDMVDLTMGANYFTQDIDYQERRQNNASGRGLLQHRAGGVFAQADITPVEGVTVTLGGRYTIEKKEAQVANFGQCDIAFQNCNFAFAGSKKWTDFTPKLGVRFQPSDDVTLYGSFTKGFRSGGFNLRNSIGPAGPYEPENVDAYEVGVKTVLFDRRLRANLAVYRNEFSNLQRQVLDDQARQRTLNAADARIQGAEFDLTLVPVDGLSLGGTLAYTNGKYSQFNGLDLTGDGIPDPDIAKNLKFARLPKWTYSLYASYEADIGDAGSLSGRVSFDHTDRRAGNDTNTFFLDGYGLLEASLTFKTADDRYSLSLFGKNLTNKLYASTGADIGTFRSVYIGAPRTWGLTFGFEF